MLVSCCYLFDDTSIFFFQLKHSSALGSFRRCYAQSNMLCLYFFCVKIQKHTGKGGGGIRNNAVICVRYMLWDLLYTGLLWRNYKVQTASPTELSHPHPNPTPPHPRLSANGSCYAGCKYMYIFPLYTFAARILKSLKICYFIIM